MSAEITGYNAAFQHFVDFAQKRMAVDDDGAVANAKLSGRQISGRSIVSVKASETDKAGFFGALFRSHDDIQANVIARKLFMDAVSDMFNGDIPDSVKAAMKLKDYGDRGHPLTARRIIAVRNAIDATGLLRDKALAQGPGFTNPATEALALQKGYSRTELFSVARATRYYQATMNCDEATAAREVMTPGSKANRLLQYGGRFLANQDNFRHGLRLLDSFSGWYANLQESVNFSRLRDFNDGQARTVSQLNVNSRQLITGMGPGYERFVFQQIAHDPDFDLKETDAEKAFGFEHNAASRFIGRGFSRGALCTVNSLSPENRRILFAVFDAFMPLAKTPAEADSMPQMNASAILIGRTLKNLHRLAVLEDRGELTARKIVEICFPDMPGKGRYDAQALNSFMEHCAQAFQNQVPNSFAEAFLGMETSGLTLPEVIAAVKDGRKLPTYPHYSPASFDLDANNGTPEKGRQQLRSDFIRTDPYSSLDGRGLLAQDALAWKVTFPDGTRHLADGRERTGGIDDIIAGVEELCGETHGYQANIVMFNMTQAGLTNLRSGLSAHGVNCDEHSPVNFALSKDAETGAITIRYSSPEGLPIHFSWESVVDIDGNVTTTPMTVTQL